LISIRGVLYDNWALTGALAKANIRFSTGWLEEDAEFPHITVTEVMSLDEPFELGYGVVRVSGTYQIDCWVQISRETAKGPGLAKAQRWAMVEEVKRILRANLTGVGDLQYVVLDQLGRSLDEVDRSPPLLRYSLQVSAIYDV